MRQESCSSRSVDIWVLRNGTREPGQGRNTAAISGQSHVPRGRLGGAMMEGGFVAKVYLSPEFFYKNMGKIRKLCEASFFICLKRKVGLTYLKE